MTLAAGTRLGPYEILAPVGSGGMGEVYRAKDTRLDRTVAVKVLASHLSGNAELRQRLDREARAISSLTHAHICALYDVGHQEGIDYLVMEYLEGESLATRLAKGPLPTDQVLRYGIEIADALQQAHRQGILHRDLKPGNVMLTRSGVKLVDFGLAKAFQRPLDAAGQEPTAAAQDPAAGNRPTAVRTLTGSPSLTEKGTILGTLPYMAPEQLEGGETDARTDIFAFGAVLYEMATGQKAFSGRSQASLIAAILSSEPKPIATLQPMSPPGLDRVVRTCLAKDPEDRWGTAHDIMLELKWIAEGGPQAGVPAPLAGRLKGRERLAWAASAVTAAVAVAATLLYLRLRSEPPRVIRSFINPPEKSQFAFDAGAMALSPDGRRIAFVARGPDGKNLLWVRPLDALAAQPLSGTEGATYPFWSPDGVFLGFFADGKLNRIDASGGAPEALCEAEQGRGGTWGREGVILFAPGVNSAIFRVSASGGTPQEVTRRDPGEYSHRWPSWLPDGRHFLYLSLAQGRGTGGIHVGSLDPKEERKRLSEANSNAVYSPPGYLLFHREKTVVAQPFDTKRLRATGEAFPVADQVSVFETRSAAFSVSHNGILAYQPGSSFGMTTQLSWLERSGKEIETLGPPAEYSEPKLSHDGRRLAVVLRDARGNADIWIYDLSRKVATRLTFDPADEGGPVWSPDDSRIVFSSARSLPENLYWKPSNGIGTEELLYKSGNRCFADSWSPDGRSLLFDAFDPKTRWDVWALSLADRKAVPVVQTEFGDLMSEFSPDGRWIAYQSSQSGRPEIYVQGFPEPRGRSLVSNAGGRTPVWARDGKEIFYLGPDGKLMAVGVRAAASGLEADVPRTLFETHMRSSPTREFDVTAGGQRFLVNAVPEQAKSTEPITLVQNWRAIARR